MAIQLSITVRNARLDAIETAIGTSAVLKFRSGSVPATCATADSGTVLATLNLPSDWLAAAASGAKAKTGTWSDTIGDSAGTIGHWRIYASNGTTCHLQGSVSTTGGGGDITLNTLTAYNGGLVTVTGFTLTDANA